MGVSGAFAEKKRRSGLGASLDRFDIALLNCVQENNQLTAQELGDRVGLSPTACQRRLKRLRADGVIIGDISIVSPRAVGSNVTLIVQVCLEHEQIHLLDEFKQRMIALPEVVQCYYVTGNVDFVLVISVESMDEYVKFTNRVFFNSSNVKSFHTSVVMNHVKFNLKVPL